MKAVVITAAAFWLIGAGSTITRKAGEPRPDNPSAGVLLAVFLTEVGLAAWALSTIL